MFYLDRKRVRGGSLVPPLISEEPLVSFGFGTSVGLPGGLKVKFGNIAENSPQYPKGHIRRPMSLFLFLYVFLSFSTFSTRSSLLFFPAVLRAGASHLSEINLEDVHYLPCQARFGRLQLVSDCLIMGLPPLCSHD